MGTHCTRLREKPNCASFRISPVPRGQILRKESPARAVCPGGGGGESRGFGEEVGSAGPGPRLGSGEVEASQVGWVGGWGMEQGEKRWREREAASHELCPHRDWDAVGGGNRGEGSPLVVAENIWVPGSWAAGHRSQRGKKWMNEEARKEGERQAETEKETLKNLTRERDRFLQNI